MNQFSVELYAKHLNNLLVITSSSIHIYDNEFKSAAPGFSVERSYFIVGLSVQTQTCNKWFRCIYWHESNPSLLPWKRIAVYDV